jgi:phage virion morphogenesis protein
MIEVKVDDKAVLTALARVAAGAAHPAPLMTRIAGIMLDAVEENFAQEGRPKWLGLKPGSVKKGRGPAKILQNTGRMAASIVHRASDTEAVVGTNVVYAAIHHFGGKTKPHVILPKKGKALKFNGRYAKKVNHPGSTIPARPFLMLAAEDEARIVASASTYLASLAG